MSAVRERLSGVPPAGPEELARGWWIAVLLGILGIIAGVIVLAWPGISLVTLALVSGIFLVVDGECPRS